MERAAATLTPVVGTIGKQRQSVALERRVVAAGAALYPHSVATASSHRKQQRYLPA